MVKVFPSEQKETESKPKEVEGKWTEKAVKVPTESSDAAPKEKPSTECNTPQKETTQTDIPTEEEHNTSPFKKAEAGHRKRNYRESNKETEDSDDFKKSRKDERSERSYEKSRSNGSGDRWDNRESRDRPRWQDIGGGYSPSSSSHYERRSFEMQGQKKYRYGNTNIMNQILKPF